MLKWERISQLSDKAQLSLWCLNTFKIDFFSHFFLQDYWWHKLCWDSSLRLDPFRSRLIMKQVLISVCTFGSLCSCLNLWRFPSVDAVKPRLLLMPSWRKKETQMFWKEHKKFRWNMNYLCLRFIGQNDSSSSKHSF